jgi:uncharacterized protein
MSGSDPTPIPPPRLARHRSVRVLLRLLALLSLGTAVLGLFLPGLPSTEFVILAAWAAARSSPRLHQWLMQHPRLGPPLQAWHDGQRVSLRGKWVSTVSMGACAVLLWFAPHPWIRWTGWVGMAIGATWLWRRPLPRR